ncbi:ADP-ribosyltransferase [Streptomyces sp. NPDC054796]
MTTTRIRGRVAAAVLTLAALLTPAAAAASPGSPGAASAAPDKSTAAPSATSKKAAKPSSCPVVSDRLHAAATRDVDLGRITPKPHYRTTCQQLYRSDGRPPSVIFAEGFQPRDTKNGQYDLEAYVLKNQHSPFVSTSYDHDLYKSWRPGYNYYIDAPGGIDVNKTIGDDHKYASQVEVAFPGGIDNDFIVGACPVDKEKRVEIMSECVDNPSYDPWRN